MIIQPMTKISGPEMIRSLPQLTASSVMAAGFFFLSLDSSICPEFREPSSMAAVPIVSTGSQRIATGELYQDAIVPFTTVFLAALVKGPLAPTLGVLRGWVNNS